jgi:hypothetical protein
MAFVPAPNIIMTEFLYTLSAQQCENRVMVNNLAAVDATALENVAVAAWDWWETNYAPLISNDCLLRAVQTTDLTTDTGGQFVYAPDGTTTGEDTGATMPNETSLCISLRSDARGRSARGRWFVAGLPFIAMLNANEVTSAYASAAVTALNGLRTAITGLSKDLVIVSYRHNKAPRPGGPVYFTVQSATIVDNIVDSQRRRKPGVGS